MKNKILLCAILLFILSSSYIVHAYEDVAVEYKQEEQKVLDNAPEIGCKSAYVVEPLTGKIMYEKAAHEKMYPASTTKILTALLALENCQPTDIVTVSQNAIDLVPEGYTNAKLKAGEQLSVEDLLYCILLPSANEAANALAEHIGGSIDAFVELANNRAKELGCETLHFVNPNGVHDDNHYCSAYDLYLIAKECTKYDLFNKIVQTTEFTLPATNIYTKEDRVLKTTNNMLLEAKESYYYPSCIGIKTGHTTQAGECFIGRYLQDGIELISVVLGGGNNSQGLNERFYDTKQLYEFVKNNYSIKEIVNTQTSILTKEIKKATKETAILDIVPSTNISSIVPNDLDIDSIETQIVLPEELYAPILENQVLGQITYHVDGLNYTVDLIASHFVEKIPYWLYNIIVVVLMLSMLIIIKTKHKKRRKK